MQANASIDKETRDDALQDLSERIDDWKSLQVGTFGELLLLGTFNVVKDERSRSEEKEYHIYLFNRILIMCKDVNANKPKNRIGNNRPALSLRGKPKMNLKGRIYFANVTQVSAFSHPGNYALQISWKGDNPIETFIIKFKNDDTLQKWKAQVEEQRAACNMEARQRGVSETQLTSLMNVQMENPYANQDDDEDYSRMSGTTYGGPVEPSGYSDLNMSRNGSSTSLRSRSATGGSGGSNPHLSQGRMRVPTGEMGLPLLNTKMPVQSPVEYPGGSYFSPIERENTPISASTRSSSQSAFGYRGTTPVNMRPEESYRNTAPAMARNTPGGNPYLVNGRPVMRPSLGPGGMQPGMPLNRMRSASSPDIHPNIQQSRKYVSGENAPTVPPIPAHVAKQMIPPSRSQNNSPSNILPIRSGTPHNQPYGLPPAPRPGMNSHKMSYDANYNGDIRQPGHAPSLSGGRGYTPPAVASQTDNDSILPNQLKAKVCFDENYVSMIIPSNISYQSLTARIDAKLAKITGLSIGAGSIRLRYQDEEGDFILIDSDEAVHEALLDWRETHAANSVNLQSAEVLLFAHAIAVEPASG